jgi:hypothetical protein
VRSGGRLEGVGGGGVDLGRGSGGPRLAKPFWPSTAIERSRSSRYVHLREVYGDMTWEL